MLPQYFYCSLLQQFPNLVAYRERGEARPAFVQALADQMAGFAAETEGEDA